MRALWVFIIMSLALLGAAGTILAEMEAEKGIALYEEGDYERAVRLFEGILAQQGGHETALLYLGKIRLDHSDLDGAKDYLEKLVEIAPNESEYQLTLANVYGQKARTSGFFLSKKKWAGRWKERLELAFELDPQNLDAREWLAIYLANAPGIGGGDKDRATRIARETIEIDEIFGRLLLAYTFRRSGEIGLAISEYQAVLDMDAANSRAHAGLGFCHLNREDFEEAERSLQRAVELNTDDSEAYEAMAYYWSKRGMEAAAAESREAALRRNSLLSDVRYELAEFYRDEDMPTEAAHHYDSLIALTPEHHKAGDARWRLKRIKKRR